MFESSPPPDPDLPGPLGREEGARRAAAEGIRRLAAGVAAVCGPRGAVARTGGERPARTPAEVVEAHPRGTEAEEVGAAVLRKAALQVEEQCGRGVGAAVCLTASLLLEALEAQGRGVTREELMQEYEAGYQRLVPGLSGLSRSATPAELDDILGRALGGRTIRPVPGEDPEAGGGPGETLHLPGRRPGVERLPLRGARVRVAPQAAGQLHQPGLREGMHRLLRIAGPVRTREEIRKLFHALATFEEPLLVLADRISPSAATDVADMVHRGQVHGHLLWWAPGSSDGDLALRRTIPEAENVLAAAALDPAGLPRAREVLWCEDGALLRLDECSHALSYTVLFAGPDLEDRRGLDRAVRLLEATRHGGMVVGGGSAYVTLARALGGAGVGERLRTCLEAPLRVLVENEGMDPESVLDRIRSLPPGSGYDVLEGRYFGPHESGPVTPAPVVAAVLEAGFGAARDFLRGEKGGETGAEGA